MATQPGEISRRRVLAGVAWTTPAIVLAVSVPKAAASVVTGVLVVDSAQVLRTSETPPRLRIDVPAIRNSGEAEWTDVVVTITIPADQGSLTFDGSNSGAGWSVSASGSGPWIYTAVYSATIPAFGTSTSGFLLVTQPADAPTSGIIAFAGTASSGADTTSIIFPNSGQISY